MGGGDHSERAGELGPGGEHLVTVGAGCAACGTAGEPAAAGGIVGATVDEVAGGIVGVLGISRSTTGGLACCAVRRAAGRPQARWAPSGPAPQSASRRTRPRTRARRPRRGPGAGAGGTGRSGRARSVLARAALVR